MSQRATPCCTLVQFKLLLGNPLFNEIDLVNQNDKFKSRIFKSISHCISLNNKYFFIFIIETALCNLNCYFKLLNVFSCLRNPNFALILKCPNMQQYVVLWDSLQSTD